MNPNQVAANPRAKENTQVKASVLTNDGSAESTCEISRRTVRFASSRSSVSRWYSKALIASAGLAYDLVSQAM